jgi:hypothetical protein
MDPVVIETERVKKLSVSDNDEDKGGEDTSLSCLDIFSADFDPTAAIYSPDLVTIIFIP